MLIAMLIAALGLTRLPEELKGPDTSVWVAVLLIQAVPYGAAVLVSIVSALSLPARWLGLVKEVRLKPDPQAEG